MSHKFIKTANYFSFIRYNKFRMVPLLTHLYMEGYSSQHTALIFTLPLALVAFLNLITAVVKILRGLTGRGIITSLLLLLVNIAQPILYMSMTMNKSPTDSFIWSVTIFALTLVLAVPIIALFFVDMTFFDQLATMIDRRRKSGVPSRVGAKRKLGSGGKPYEITASVSS